MRKPLTLLLVTAVIVFSTQPLFAMADNPYEDDYDKDNAQANTLNFVGSSPEEIDPEGQIPEPADGGTFQSRTNGLDGLEAFSEVPRIPVLERLE